MTQTHNHIMNQAPQRGASSGWTVLIAVVSLACLAGCGTPSFVDPDWGPAIEAKKAAFAFMPPEGKANLYFTRKSKMLGAAVTTSVEVDGIPAGTLNNGSFTRLFVDPGKYVVSYPVKERRGPGVTIMAEAGRNYMIECGPNMDLTLVPEEQGRNTALAGKYCPDKQALFDTSRAVARETANLAVGVWLIDPNADLARPRVTEKAKAWSTGDRELPLMAYLKNESVSNCSLTLVQNEKEVASAELNVAQLFSDRNAYLKSWKRGQESPVLLFHSSGGILLSGLAGRSLKALESKLERMKSLTVATNALGFCSDETLLSAKAILDGAPEPSKNALVILEEAGVVPGLTFRVPARERIACVSKQGKLTFIRGANVIRGMWQVTLSNPGLAPGKARVVLRNGTSTLAEYEFKVVSQ